MPGWQSGLYFHILAILALHPHLFFILMLVIFRIHCTGTTTPIRTEVQMCFQEIVHLSICSEKVHSLKPLSSCTMLPGRWSDDSLLLTHNIPPPCSPPSTSSKGLSHYFLFLLFPPAYTLLPLISTHGTESPSNVQGRKSAAETCSATLQTQLCLAIQCHRPR